MPALIQDLRLAVRSLRRAPGFVIVAVATLALGIGANSAMFSIIRAVLLRPLPYPEPDRLTQVWEHNVLRHGERNVVAPANYLRWRDRATSFTGLAAYSWASTVFTGGDAPQRVSGRAVSTNLFSVLGAAPQLGRGFTAEEGLPGASPVVVLSHGLWRQRFGADPAIVGRQVQVAGGSVAVVGVMPADFRPLGNEQYWEPFVFAPELWQPRGRYMMVVGRLKDGITQEQAQAEMRGLSLSMEKELPDFDTGWSSQVIPLAQDITGRARPALLILLGAVSLVLLIACANVANLMLARAVGRQRETAVRLALGASRRRMASQWLAECLLLAGLGSALGILLAVWGVDLLKAMAPSGVPRLGEIRIDGVVLAVTGGVTLAVAVLFSLPTALGLGGKTSAVQDAGTRMTATGATARLRQALVVAQLALALVLLAGAGLLIRSLQQLLAVSPGFEPAGVLSLDVSLPDANYPDEARRIAFFKSLMERIRGIPGVEQAGVVSWLPLIEQGSATTFTVVGRQTPPPGQEPVADIRIADEGYFSTLRIPLRRGRLLAATDGAKAPAVAVINETMARELWPDADPLGARVQVDWWHPEIKVEVVGVVGDVRTTGLDVPLRPMLYYPMEQSPFGSLSLVLRGRGDPASYTPAVRGAIRDLDAGLPFENVTTLEDQRDRSVADRRYPLLLLGLFATLALSLAAVGLYGVVAYGVSQRGREFGVRIALGASAGQVVRLVLGDGARLAALGVAGGTLGALAAGPLLRKLLYGVGPADPLTFVLVALGLTAVVLFAAWLPARRAARVDPIVVLRSE